MDTRLDSRDEEFCQLCPQLQEDRAKMAALLLQLQEMIASVEKQSEVVEKDQKEVNGHFDHHR